MNNAAAALSFRSWLDSLTKYVPQRNVGVTPVKIDKLKLNRKSVSQIKIYKYIQNDI